MKGFRFKLQPILKVKELEEDRLLGEFTVLKGAHEDATRRLNQLTDTKEGYLHKIQSTEGEGALDVEWAILQRNYLNHLRREISEAGIEKQRRKEAMDQGFELLVEKTKERKILEKLKEKHQTTFVANQLRKMQNELDDLAQGRFNYQKKHLEAER